MVHGAVVVVLVVRLAAHALPHAQELPGKPPSALALQADAAVLPIAEALDDIGVLIGDIGAAGVGDVAVHAGDLPVVAVVEVEAVHIVVHRVEYHDLHTGVLQLFQPLIGHTHHAAEVVKQQLDLHAQAALAAEDVGQPVPYLALGHDEVLQENEPLRLLQPVHHIVEIRLAGGQIRHLGIAEQRGVLAAEIIRHRIPLGRGLAQLFQIGPCDLLLGKRFSDRHGFLQVQALGLAVAAPQQIQDEPHHRHEQYQDDPAHLIAGGAGARPDTHGHDTGQQLQHGIGQRHALLEQVTEDHHQGYLRQQQHRHQHKAQRGGYAAFRPLLYLRLFHR